MVENLKKLADMLRKMGQMGQKILMNLSKN